MRILSKRLDKIETVMTPEGRPFIFWAMKDGRRMTEGECANTFANAVADGRARATDKPLAVCWKM